MQVVSIYNNKGGEGKSTVTVGLAEFLAGNRNKRVLIIDLDAQASSSCALLGHESVNLAVTNRQTHVDLINEIRQSRRRVRNLEQYLLWRPATDARSAALAEIAVLVPDGSRQFEVEEQMSWRRDSKLMLSRLKPALEEFDYVLIDLPANLSRSSVIPMNGLAMSDFVMIPVRPTEISLNGLPRTFEMIEHARSVSGSNSPAVVGFLLNATDRRYQQYKANFPPFLEEVAGGKLPPVFDNVWPPSPALQTATAANRTHNSLKERFGRNYDHARKAAIELDVRCSRFNDEEPVAPLRKTIWQKHGFA